MIQRYHLLVRSPSGAECLVQEHACGWLLPIAAGYPRTRASAILQRRSAAIGAPGLPIVVAYGSYGERHHEADWLGVLTAVERVNAPALKWLPREELLAQSGLVEFQQASVRRYLNEENASPQFMSPDWPHRARTWIDQQLGKRESTTGPMSVFRCAPSYVGARFETMRTPVYFKAVPRGRAFAEAALTCWFSQQAPESFAPTKGIDFEGGRWLGGHVDGVPLRKANSTVLEAVIREIVKLQIRFIDQAEQLRVRGAWPATIDSIEQKAIDLLRDPPEQDLERAPDMTTGSPDRTVRTIGQTFEYLRTLDLPSSWVPLDIAPDNVIVADDRPVFIDVGDCWVGPAPAALEVLFQGLSGNQPELLASPADRDRLKTAFVDAWSRQCSPNDLRRGLALMPLIVCIVQTLRGLEWIRTRTKEGEIIGFESHVRRLAVRRIIEAAAVQARAAV